MKNASRLLISLVIAGCVFLIGGQVQALDISSACPDGNRVCTSNYLNVLNRGVATDKYWIPLQIAIPMPGCNEVESFACANNTVVGVRSIADLTVALFQFATILIAVFLTLMMVIGGVMYIVSGGAADYVSKAKSLIKNSALSLVVVFFAYVLLYQIDPRLTSPNLTQLETIQRVDCCQLSGQNEFYFAEFNSETKLYQCTTGDQMVEDIKCLRPSEFDSGGEQSASRVISDVGDLIEMKSVNGITVIADYGKYITPDIWADLNEVAAEMQSYGFGGIVVTSGARTVEAQITLAQDDSAACQIQNNRKESCPHTSGIAVDVWGAIDGKQCVYKSAAEPRCWAVGETTSTANIIQCLQNPCHRALVDAMLRKGYCILLGSDKPRFREVWHFEKSNPPLSSGCVYQIPSKYLVPLPPSN